MASVLRERRSVNGRAAALDAMIEQANSALERAISQGLNQWWQAAVTTLLGRQRHVRRHQVRPWVEQTGCCARYSR